ncbi:MAG: hypothetical protein K2J82_09940 [Muribaculaceae bacterium]|nr:hypothetical protein [Muribaculaceae bacterium]
MKTSFYFVLWIAIYPILGLFNIPFLNNNSFIVALIIVWGLSAMINKMMPQILIYEQACNMFPIFEDIFTGNVKNFYKRLNRQTIIETITAIYFCVTMVVIAFAIFSRGLNDWFALLIFALFTYGAIARSVQLSKARYSLKENPTKEECEEIAVNTYKFDYADYARYRSNTTAEQMLPPIPKHFKAFQIVSLIFAIIAAILGLIYLVYGIVVFFSSFSVDAWAFGMMGCLYGSLAIYFGIRDFISILPHLRKSQYKSL